MSGKTVTGQVKAAGEQIASTTRTGARTVAGQTTAQGRRVSKSASGEATKLLDDAIGAVDSSAVDERPGPAAPTSSGRRPSSSSGPASSTSRAAPPQQGSADQGAPPPRLTASVSTRSRIPQILGRTFSDPGTFAPSSLFSGSALRRTCPGWDSNPHRTDFEAVASANWATGALDVPRLAVPPSAHLGGRRLNHPVRGGQRLRHPGPRHYRSVAVCSRGRTSTVALMLAFTFPGQGSQRPGMGRPWIDHESWGARRGGE